MAQLPDLTGDEIADLAAFFRRTKNPAAAWRVFHLCRKFDRPIPPEIDKEVDRFAGAIARLAERATQVPPSKTKLHVTTEDIGSLWRGGKSNPLGALQKEWRDSWVFAEILRRVENYDMPVGEAQVAVVKSLGVGFDAVVEIWKRRKRRTPR